MSFKVSLFFLGLVLIFFFRFYGLTWGSGYFFHPDENNMASSLSKLSTQSLDPQFYAYGQTPTYLGFFLLKLFGLKNNFENSVYVLRFISAVSSVVAIYFFIKLVKVFQPKIKIYIPFLLFLTSPGLIQLARFGTTESLIITFFLGSFYYFTQKRLLLSACIFALGVACKISFAIFLVFPILFLIKKQKIQLAKFLLVVLLLSSLASPYNIINFKDFQSSMRYETEVARGITKVFYTNQFLETIPYLFQFKNIFPFAVGPIQLFLFLPAFLFCLNKYRKNFTFYILILTCLVYFLYFGQLYTKWSRFMSPVFFIFPLVTSMYLSQLKNKTIQLVLLFLCLLPGLTYLQIYFKKDIRIYASEWIEGNIKGRILSEGGNVVNLPLKYSQGQEIYNFDFYTLENNPQKSQELQREIVKANYILVPSRRVFANQKGEGFPESEKYYQSLFDGSLGFVEIKKFQNLPDFLNLESLEETITVFDNPTIRVFKKI